MICRTYGGHRSSLEAGSMPPSRRSTALPPKPAIVKRIKHVFAIPIGGLIRTLFRERCYDVLLSRANPVADWFERGAIERFLDEHQTGRCDHGKKLWALFMLFTVAASRPAQAPIAPIKIPAFA